MKTARFWTGTALLLTPCVLAILAASPGYDSPGSGRVEGQVTYKGRPVTGGTVLFLSADRKRGDDKHASIDDQGHYEISPNWRREGPDRTRFQICVLLDPRKYPLDPPPADSGAMPGPDERGGPRSRGGEGKRPIGRIVRASWVPRGPKSADRAVEPVRQHRFSDPGTSDLSVRLGPEPAQVDIDLKD